MNSWNDETKKKILDLSKRSVDIKDFSKYKSSDIENITLLNTLVNTWISKLYEDLANSMNRNSSTIETQLPTSAKNDQEVKSDEDSQNKVINIEITDNSLAKTSEESKIEVAEDGKTKSSEPIGIFNELEQGSEINLNNLEHLSKNKYWN